ncbi:hypothetical protein KIW84_022273 [Lathyrus oleraceus]|uniref:Uncharacterized protein n=1 Tax=Pisum sativum TaxID=3888 RepID=A0A9D4YCR0_PEA|nr:hypothetical protein KIW84_022273 [Pisum sativum]
MLPTLRINTGEFKVFDVRFIRRSLVQIHKDICLVSDCEHDHDGCVICSMNPRGYDMVKRDIQRLMDEGMIQIVQSGHVDDNVNVIVPVFKQPERLVIQYDSSSNKNVSNRSVSPLVILLAGPVPYASDKVVLYQYNATMIENGQEVPLPMTSSIVNIADVTKVTRSGLVFGSVVLEEVIVGKKVEIPNSTLSKLSYQGAPMRYSGVIVKAFDGSRKTVIGEVDLPVKIGLSDFHITFQLKFFKNGKLVIIGGEKALLVSHLLSFSYVEVEDEVGTSFQALSIAVEKRIEAPMSSLKDAQKIVEEGPVDQWGSVVEVSDNKGITGLGFHKGSSIVRSEEMQLSFRSGGFIHGNEQHLAAVLENSEEEDCTNFVTHGRTCNNWTAVDIPIILHRSKLVPNPIEYNDPSPSPKFEFPVFEAEEESDVEVSDELSRLLEQDEKIIQPFEEQIELVNLGSEDDVKEVKIGSRLCPDAKKGLIDLLQEYSDVFAWSYQNMPRLDSDIVEHRLSLKPECPPVK